MACSLATTIPMLIRLHLDHITLLDRLAAEVEDEIEAAVDAIPAAWGITEEASRLWILPGAAVLPAAQRLSEIPGISLKLARPIIAETGLDMTRFPTASHLVSWAGLAPVARQSGPRQRKLQKGQADAYLKTSDAAKLSSCVRKFPGGGGEGGGFVVVLAGGQAVVQAAERLNRLRWAAACRSPASRRRS